MFEIFTKEGLIDTLYFLPALLIATAIHEFSHAYVAYKLGDESQKQRGRLTLSPFAHIDPMGLIFILLFRFGWGRPVVIDDRNFKNRGKGTMLVALAGPVSNIILSIATTILLKLLDVFGLYGQMSGDGVGHIIIAMLFYVIQFNMIFAVFNLLPIPPFDGYKVLYYFLPYKAKQYAEKIERYSFWILLLLIFTDAYIYLIQPLYTVLATIISLILMI